MQPSVAEPRLRPLEEPVRGLLIVTAFEESEETDSIIMMFVVPSVLDSRHPTDGSAIAPGDEERPLRPLIEGIPTPVEAISDNRTKRSNPAGRDRLVVDSPSSVNEPRRTPAALHLGDLKRRVQLKPPVKPPPSWRTVVKKCMSDSLLKTRLRESTSHFGKTHPNGLESERHRALKQRPRQAGYSRSEPVVHALGQCYTQVGMESSTEMTT
jgi:hypothetical protein